MSSENTVIESEVVETKADCSEAVSLASTLTEQLAELKASNEKLEASLVELTSVKDSELTSIKEANAQKLTEMQESIAKLELELNTANEALAAYKTKEMDMMKKEKKMKRQATYIVTGKQIGRAHV